MRHSARKLPTDSGRGRIKEHKTSRQEIADLFLIADRDLKACLTPSLSPKFRAR
jgi:hypothetical protein